MRLTVTSPNGLKSSFKASAFIDKNEAQALSASGLAGVIATLSPQPQAEVSLGLEKAKLAERRSILKSIWEPSKNSTALGSISRRTPLSSTTSSSGETDSASSIVYDIPAQPPFLTPTRRPATGLPAA